MAPFFKRHYTLQKARRNAEEQRSPESIAALAEAQFRYGEPDNALETLREGLEHFPYSSQLTDLYTHVQRSQLAGRVRQLQETLERSPTPLRYVQLAEAYRELGEINKVLEILTTGVQQFPESSDLYFHLGEVRLRRFCDDLLVKDGVMAVRNLEEALDIDPVHGQALKLLGRLYLQMGAFARATQYLSLQAQNHPPDEGITALLELARQREEEDEDELLEDLLAKVSAHRRFKVDIGDLSIELAPLSVELKIATATADVETLPNSLEPLAAMKGFQAAFLFDEQGPHLVRCETPELVDAEKVGGALASILANSRDASQRMDVGRFSKGTVSGPAGTISLVSFGNAALAVMWDESVKTTVVETELDQLIEHVLGESIREGS